MNINFMYFETEFLRNIRDPEHPVSLEELGVIKLDLIDVNNDLKTVNVKFTPTISNCSLAGIIGLCICVKLQRSLPIEYKYNVEITHGTHDQEDICILKYHFIFVSYKTAK